MSLRKRRNDRLCCSICGGTDFVDAVDNHGKAYRGCSRCVVFLAERSSVVRCPRHDAPPANLAFFRCGCRYFPPPPAGALETTAKQIATDPPGDDPIALWREWCSRDITETDDEWASFTNRVHAMLKRRGIEP